MSLMLDAIVATATLTAIQAAKLFTEGALLAVAIYTAAKTGKNKKR
ncbi:MAG: hypothetical protein ACI4NN_04715 [Pyramidobacter sp.]